jgi:hypothetical protein
LVVVVDILTVGNLDADKKKNIVPKNRMSCPDGSGVV